MQAMLLLVNGNYRVLEPVDVNPVLEFVMQTIAAIMPVCIMLLGIFIGIGLIPVIINKICNVDGSCPCLEKQVLDRMFKRRLALKRRVESLDRMLEGDLSECDDIFFSAERIHFADEIAFTDHIIDLILNRKVGFLEGCQTLTGRFLTYIKTKKKGKEGQL